MSDKDLLFRAAFEDQTQAFFDQFNQNVNQMRRGMNASLNQMQTQGKKSAATIGLIAGVVGGLTAKLAGMALNAARAFPCSV